jgi:hypothetical protein
MLTTLIPPPYRLLAAGLAALALVAGGFAAGWTFQGWKSKAAIAAVQANHNEQVRQAVKAERDGLASVLAEERALRADMEGQADAARQDLAATAAAVAVIATERDGLRGDLRRYSAARACTPGAAAGPAAGSPAGTSAGVVPADVRDQLLDEAAAALGELAPALDSARTRHAACVGIWNQARERLKRLGEAGRTVDGPQ